MAQQLSTNTFGVAKWIVSAKASQGTHTTIGGAIAAASSGDTIVVMPGTYTENNTVTINLNITAFSGDSYVSGNVTVIGGFTVSSNITLNISNIKLQTNTNNVVSVGSSGAVVNLTKCFIFCANSIGINISAGIINLLDCTGLGSVGSNQYFVGTGGSINLNNCNLQGGATAVSSLAGTGITINNSIHQGGLTISGTGSINAINSTLGVTSSSLTPLTQGGSATSFCYNCQFLTGTPSAISVGATLTLSLCVILSNNTNAITGAGTLIYSGLTFTGTSSKINTTTQTGGLLPGGVSQAPTAGFIGEQIRATVAKASHVSTPSTNQVNVTSISLTAGIWDVTGIIQFDGITTGTQLNTSISTTSGTNGTAGDNLVEVQCFSQTTSDQGITIPPYRITLSTTTTVYLVAQAIYTVGTGNAYGRISATRVG